MASAHMDEHHTAVYSAGTNQPQTFLFNFLLRISFIRLPGSWNYTAITSFPQKWHYCELSYKILAFDSRLSDEPKNISASALSTLQTSLGLNGAPPLCANGPSVSGNTLLNGILPTRALPLGDEIIGSLTLKKHPISIASFSSDNEPENQCKIGIPEFGYFFNTVNTSCTANLECILRTRPPSR